MVCVVKATYLSESRRFTLAEIHPENLNLCASKLTYEILHNKICSLFNKNSMSIRYVDNNGTRKTIKNDHDVLQAINDFSLSLQPSPTTLILRLDVEPCEQISLSEESFDLGEQIVAAVAACGLEDKPQRNKDSNASIKTDSSADRKAKETVHQNVYCDICLNTIRGIRWKCQDCDNYDLCQSCHSLSGLRHPYHTFKPIAEYNGEAATTGSKPRDALQHGAMCDICLTPIVGVRYKCLQCPDYDLCQGCLPLSEEKHKSHTFFPISYPGQVQVKLDQTPHTRVQCDHCHNEIFGVRYKCGNCQDYDLCGNCEALPEPVHNSDHIFLKIRKPIPQRTIAATPIIPNMYRNGWDQAVCFHPQQTGQACPIKTTTMENTQESSQKITEPVPPETLNSKFVRDVTQMDGTTILPGATFEKVWELTNSGQLDWPEGTVLSFTGGDRMFADDLNPLSNPEIKVNPTSIGEYICISVDLKAPTVPGRYISYWILTSPSGERFGHRVWCDITVVEPVETPTSVEPVETVETVETVAPKDNKFEEAKNDHEDDEDDDDFVVIDTDDGM
ncbi:hypothetical protein BGZ76_008584 [Entomortierella beljakovae]|nr:hypothetical protein BGZ76_008584 [Entomortierella beljakovae]